MFRLIRPVAVFGVASCVSVAAFHMTGGAHGGNGDPGAAPAGPLDVFSLGAGYDLAQLEILETTLYHVEESYVEPGRIDYEKMFVASLEAVERRVPSAMFRREPGSELLHLEVGDYRTILEIPTVGSRRDLQRELKGVAVILGQRLRPEDIPSRRAGENPYAEVEYALVNGVLSTLDPHSLLLPPEDSKNMDVENQGEFGGLGITIVDREGKLTVEYPLKDTPAERAGLQPDDHIVRIDGESTINMSLEDAVRRLRGPVGAPVTIEVMREGLNQAMPVEIVRARIKINPIGGELLEGGVGYVEIKSFHANVDKQLHAELSRLNKESGGLKGLVLDLRGNPGGYLNQAVAVSETFLSSGVIVSTVDGQNRKRDEEVAHASGTEPNYPIVVLVDANSASASEIVSGALLYNERAVIVGERTFGKGSVQNLHPFVDSSKLKLTISKYLTPGDRSIQSIGVPADVQLVPTIIETRDVEGVQEPFASLYWRDRVRREADLDKHLEQTVLRADEPAYVLRYKRDGDQKKKGADRDLAKDYQVQFARDVILAAPSGRRAEVLASAAAVVARHQKQGNTDIVEAFKALGVDWSEGPSRQTADLKVHFDLGEDGQLLAGQEEVVGLEVTNTGSEPLYRLVALSASDNDVLDGREFIIGKLAPGETRRYEHRVRMLDGWPTEVTPVSFQFHDIGNDELVTKRAQLSVQGRDLPSFAWSWKVVDADGDGMVSVGERIRLDLTVTNRGKGDTVEAIAKVENTSGRSLDIVKGTLEPGNMVNAAGQRCEPTEPETDIAHAVWPSDCARRLAPGESWTGGFEFEVKERPTSGILEFEMTLVDVRAYDHASIVRAGNYSYFMNREKVKVPVGPVASSEGERVGPEIEITSAPRTVVEQAHVTVSGKITDDQGLAHVMVYHGDDKVFYQGNGRKLGVKSVPFTADLDLTPGINTVTILATDQDGYTHTRSVVTYYLTSELQAQVGALKSGHAPGKAASVETDL